MTFIDNATRYLFFTGKGGVGKTSIACASGVNLADRGRRVLIVSTDPASNLDAVLGVDLSSQPAPIDAVPQLFAVNIDPQRPAAEYREGVIGPFRGVLADDEVARMEQQLAGACAVEIAVFDQFSTFLGDQQVSLQFDHILLDTAPTGHTLRLLQLPAEWTEFLERNRSEVLYRGPRLGVVWRSCHGKLRSPSDHNDCVSWSDERSALARDLFTNRDDELCRQEHGEQA